MKALSLFTGIGGIDLALESEGVDIVAMCEIDPFCQSILKEHFPNTPLYDDIRTLNGSDYVGVDMVVGGFPCFHGKTKILTKSGLRDIDSINIGDEVLTHNNVYRRVLSKMITKDKPLYSASVQGLPKILCTKEHPFYVREKTKNGFSEPYWASVCELRKNIHYCSIPINQINENPYNLTEQDCYILGRYLADGHTIKTYRHSEGRPNDRNWGLVLSIGEHKLATLRLFVVGQLIRVIIIEFNSF